MTGLSQVVIAGAAFGEMDGAVPIEAWRTARAELADDPTVIAYYDFEEGEGAVLTNRSALGAALDGAIRGAAWRQGRWPNKNALYFDGEASLVQIPSHAKLIPLHAPPHGTGQLTLELWMKPASLQECGILDKSSMGSGAAAPFMIWLLGGRLAGLVPAPASQAVVRVDDHAELRQDAWTHVALVVDAESVTLYRDGEQVAHAARQGEVFDNGKPLVIGAMGEMPAGKFYFKGLIDELVIYNRALTGEQVKQRAALVPDPAQWQTGPVAITPTSPRSGETWSVGSQHHLTWRTNRITAKQLVKIELSTDGGRTWGILHAATPNTGTMLWRVPPTTSDTCRLRISASEVTGQMEESFSIIPTQQVSDYRWVKVTDNATFVRRDGAGALVHQGRMWLIGGWNPTDKGDFPRICNNDVWSSIDGATWTQDKPNTYIDSAFDADADWEGRHYAGYVVFKDKMWIVGGDPNQGHYMFDVWNSSNGKDWHYVNRGQPVPWGPRALHYTVAFKDKIWVMGGQTMPNFAAAEEAFYRDIWASEDGVTWEQVIPNEPFWPQRGLIGGSVVFKDRMWVIGGGTYHTPQRPYQVLLNDVWSSADGVNWRQHLEHAPWPARKFHDVAVFDDRIWVLEGIHPTNSNDVWYSADGVNWYELPNTPWVPRHAASIWVHDGALWLSGGMQNDVWKLVRGK